MRYLWQHIKLIVNTYDGGVPLSHFLKNYCKQHPKLGSRDRRMLSAIVYSWYRCSKGVINNNIVDAEWGFENKIMFCLEQCGANIKAYEKLFVDTPLLSEKHSLDVSELFTADVKLSDGINKRAWLQSMLSQPQLFIRVRKDKEYVLQLLNKKQIPYSAISENCISLPNGAPIDTLLPPDSYVVQDASSQATGAYFNPVNGERWYDCCSGAGGKSLLLMDLGVNISLTVTDTRDSIISNLKQRFRLYGHKLPAAYTLDAADNGKVATVTGNGLFDNIICDAPCTGSGTWARTPEQLYFFDEKQIADFAARQTAIALNVASCLNKGGRLIYITCSVFRQENEDVVKAITDNTNLHVQHQQLINGIAQGADSMFVAILI